MKRIMIRNTTASELGVMLEPWTDREDVEAGGTLVVEGKFADEEIIVDVGDENFLSIWCPPGCRFVKF